MTQTMTLADLILQEESVVAAMQDKIDKIDARILELDTEIQTLHNRSVEIGSRISTAQTWIAKLRLVAPPVPDLRPDASAEVAAAEGADTDPEQTASPAAESAKAAKSGTSADYDDVRARLVTILSDAAGKEDGFTGMRILELIQTAMGLVFHPRGLVSILAPMLTDGILIRDMRKKHAFFYLPEFAPEELKVSANPAPDADPISQQETGSGVSGEAVEGDAPCDAETETAVVPEPEAETGVDAPESEAPAEPADPVGSVTPVDPIEALEPTLGLPAQPEVSATPVDLASEGDATREAGPETQPQDSGAAPAAEDEARIIPVGPARSILQMFAGSAG